MAKRLTAISFGLFRQKEMYLKTFKNI